MTKINFIASWNIKCGIATYSKFLTDELKKYDDIEINICPIEKSGSRNPLSFYKLLKNIQKNQITHIQYQSDLFGPFIPNFSLSYFPVLIFLLKYWKKNKVITTVHEIDLNSKIDNLILKFLNLSDKLIAHNKKLKENMENHGISSEKITLMPHGTPEKEILNKKESKKKLDLIGKKVLTIFGFVQQSKGHDLIVDALSELDEDVILYIAGEARIKEHKKYYNVLKKRTSDLKLDDRVIFSDFVDDHDLPIVFGATDLCIFPYKHVIISGALHLALSYKIPTITSNLNYFKEIKNGYDCIELFKNENKQDLLEKIRGLIDSIEKQNYLKERCKHFLEKTSWKAVGLKTRNLYLTLIH